MKLDRTSIALGVVAVLLLAVAPLLPKWAMSLANVALCYGIVVLGMMLLMRTGLVSFGHGLYYCLGAYAAGTVDQIFKLPDMALMVAAGAVVTGVVAAILGLLLARYRDIFFAMLSLAFSMILYGLLVKSSALGSTDGFNISAKSIFGVAVVENSHRYAAYGITVVMTMFSAFLHFFNKGDYMNLNKLGFDDFFIAHFNNYKNKGYIPARVISQQKNNYLICYENGTVNAKISGKFLYTASVKKNFPTVGDWVAIKLSGNDTQAVIHAVLERKTAFVRKLAISGGRKIKNGIIVGGSTEEQVIASNVDIVFIVSGLDENFNLQRIERYITLTYNSGAIPVIILNKMDCCKCVDEYIGKVRDIALGIEIHTISVLKNIGMAVFNQYLLPGKTVYFLVFQVLVNQL